MPALRAWKRVPVLPLHWVAGNNQLLNGSEPSPGFSPLFLVAQESQWSPNSTPSRHAGRSHCQVGARSVHAPTSPVQQFPPPPPVIPPQPSWAVTHLCASVLEPISAPSPSPAPAALDGMPGSCPELSSLGWRSPNALRVSVCAS